MNKTKEEISNLIDYFLEREKRGDLDYGDYKKLKELEFCLIYNKYETY